MNRLAFAVLWLFVFAVPMEDSIAFESVGTISRIFGIAAMIIGLLAILQRARLRPLAAFHGYAFGFVMLGALSVTWSIDTEGTLGILSTYVQLALAVWLIWEIARTEKHQRALMQAYVIGASVSAIATIRVFLTEGIASQQRFAAEGFNANDLGAMLVLAIPLAWYLSISGQRQWVKWLNRAYTPLCVCAVMLTASRGALLEGLVALLALPLSLLRASARTRVVAIGALAVSGLVAYQYVPSVSWERLATTRSEIAVGDLNSRREIWSAGLQLVVDHPLVGVGVGAFPVAVGPKLGRSIVAHNGFLSVLVELGIVGFVLFIGMWVTVGIGLRYLPHIERGCLAVLFMTVVATLLPASWEHRKPTWIFLGLLAARISIARPRRVAATRPAAPAWQPVAELSGRAS
jgi:O-antigen ligase